jgi:PAS domain S-box-containing protein
MQRVLSSNIIGLTTGDPHRTIQANDAFLAIVGYSREDLAAGLVNWRRMTPPEYARLDRHALRELTSRGECTPYEKEYVRKDGTRVPVCIGLLRLDSGEAKWMSFVIDLANRDSLTCCAAAARPWDVTQGEVRLGADGRPHRLLGEDIDVTARKLAKDERYWAERRLHLAMEAGRLGSWELDLLRNTAKRSARHDQIFGYKDLLPEWRYEHLMRHVLPEDRAAVHGAFRSALESGNGWSFACRIRRADGAVRWVEGHSAPERDDSGAIVRLLGTIADITERKRLEEELRATIVRAEEASQAKSRLLAATSHDLRQPLQAILATFRMIEPDVRTPSRRQILVEGERRVKRMADDLDRLMQLSQCEGGGPEPHREVFTIDDLTADVVELAKGDAHQKGLSFDTALCGADVYTDRGMLKVILRNLVDNALKYTPEGRVWIDYERYGEALCIAVHDTGVGIPEEKRALIFEEFYRTDPDRGFGMGLGLAIVKRTADLLGHSMAVTSEVGRGSCFVVQVPLASGEG